MNISGFDFSYNETRTTHRMLLIIINLTIGDLCKKNKKQWVFLVS